MAPDTDLTTSAAPAPGEAQHGRHHPAPAPRRRAAGVVLVVVVAVLVVVAAIVAVRVGGDIGPGAGAARTGSVGAQQAGSGEADVSDGRIGDRLVTAFDDEPAIDRLDPDLLAALRAATRDAAADGIDVEVTSGWRSASFQRELLDEAVETYGSLAEARRWVNTPERSTHVTGAAVDVGPTDAAYWFAQHGADHGLCQVYANEVWHYELLVAPGGTCPAPHADGTS